MANYLCQFTDSVFQPGELAFMGQQFKWCYNTLTISALRHSTTLKILQLDGIISTRVGRDSASVITNAAWRDLFAGVVQSTTCTLERLQLSACYVNDDILKLQINAIAHNNRLREVNLSDNPGVTDAGWEAFSAILRNPTLMSVLEELHLSWNSINDRAVASFAGTLVANNKLLVLYLSYFFMLAPFFQSNPAIKFLEIPMPIGRIGFGALVTLLQNPRSNLTECPRHLLGHWGAWLEWRFSEEITRREITIKWIWK